MVQEAEELVNFNEKIKQANISLILNGYEDIFSSFDPRGYSERALSDDFLQECKRAARDKDQGLELRILVPKEKRNLREEWKIKKRLKEHFKHHHEIEKKEQKKIIAEGILWIALGTTFILTVTWMHTKEFTNFFLRILETMFEPAGWFSFWEGLGKIFIVTKEHSGDYIFYKKMSQAEVDFVQY